MPFFVEVETESAPFVGVAVVLSDCVLEAFVLAVGIAGEAPGTPERETDVLAVLEAVGALLEVLEAELEAELAELALEELAVEL